MSPSDTHCPYQQKPEPHQLNCPIRHVTERGSDMAMANHHDGGHAMRRVHFERCDEDAQDAANWFDTKQYTVVEPSVRRLGYSPTREEWRAEYSLTFQGFEIASRLAADCHDAHSARAER